MADLSKLRFNGTDYNVKDASAPKRKFDNTYAKTGNLPISSDDTTQTAIGKLEKAHDSNKANILSVLDANGQKNVFNPVDVSEMTGIPSGVTFVKNKDNSITINGTTPSGGFIYVKIGVFNYDAESYTILNSHIKTSDGTGIVAYYYTQDDHLSSNSETPRSYTYTESGKTAVWIRLSAGRTFDNATITPMICIKSVFDVSPTYDPFALPNRDLTPALAEVVNSGAKNLFEMSSANLVRSTESNYSVTGSTFQMTSSKDWSYTSFVIKGNLDTTKTYVLSFRITAESHTSGSTESEIRICPTNLGGNPIINPHITGTGTYAIEFKPTSSTMYLTMYANPSGNSSLTNSFTVTDVMICTEADWKVSQKSVPYRPPYDSLEQKPYQIPITSESVLNDLPAGTITGNLEAMIAGIASGTWVVVTTVDLNTSSGNTRRRMQTITDSNGKIAARLYHTGAWLQWHYGHNDATKIFERTTSGNETISNISPYGSFQLIAYDTTNKDAFSTSFPLSSLSGNLKLSVTGANGAVIGTILRSGSTTTYACTVANGYTLVLFGY